MNQHTGLFNFCELGLNAVNTSRTSNGTHSMFFLRPDRVRQAYYGKERVSYP